MMLKKWIAIGLAALTLFGVVACQTSDDEPGVTTGEVVTTTGEVVTQGGVTIPCLDYDFNGKTYEFGTQTNAFNGYDYRLAIIAPEGSADIVDVAVLDRNAWVEDNLNCKIAIGDIHWGNWNTIQANIMSGDCTFETMFLQFSSTCSTYITGGYYADMKALDIDWETEYWNPGANQSLEILGKQYCAVTDISYMSFYGYALAFFNSTVEDELLTSGELEKRLYDIVLDGEFTLDKMIEIGRKAVKDIDGGGILYSSDRVGITSDYSHIRTLLVAGGYNFVQTDEDGRLYSSVDGKGFESYYSKIFDLFTNTDVFCPYNEYIQIQEDRTLFGMATFPPLMREKMDAGNYGFLPMPKGTEAQADYLTPASMWNGQLLGLPISTPSANYEFISAVLNAMAYKSYTDVNEAFYNYALNYKHAQDDESIEMFRIIRNGITYDYAFGFDFADCCSNLDKMVSRGINTFSSTYNGMKDAMNTEIEELMAKLTG